MAYLFQSLLPICSFISIVSCAFIRFSEIELIEPDCWPFLSLGCYRPSLQTRARKITRGQREKGKEKEKKKQMTFSGIEKRKDPPAADCDFSLDFHVHFLIPQVGSYRVRSNVFHITIFQTEDFVLPFSILFSLSLSFCPSLIRPSISFNRFALPNSRCHSTSRLPKKVSRIRSIFEIELNSRCVE